MIVLVIILLVFWFWVMFIRDNDKEASKGFMIILSVMFIITVVIGIILLITEGLAPDPNYDMPIGR